MRECSAVILDYRRVPPVRGRSHVGCPLRVPLLRVRSLLAAAFNRSAGHESGSTPDVITPHTTASWYVRPPPPSLRLTSYLQLVVPWCLVVSRRAHSRLSAHRPTWRGDACNTHRSLCAPAMVTDARLNAVVVRPLYLPSYLLASRPGGCLDICRPSGGRAGYSSKRTSGFVGGLENPAPGGGIVEAPPTVHLCSCYGTRHPAGRGARAHLACGDRGLWILEPRTDYPTCGF